MTGVECVEGMASGLYEELFGAIVSLINRYGAAGCCGGQLLLRGCSRGAFARGGMELATAACSERKRYGDVHMGDALCSDLLWAERRH